MKTIPELLDSSKEGTTIDPSISFKGEMHIGGKGSVHIGGSFEGRIVAEGGSVIVQKGGHVQGTILAANIVISGTVTPLGDSDYIEASEFLALTETAKVTSPSILYGNMAMEFGASIQGGMTPMTKTTAAAAAIPTSPTSKVVSMEPARQQLASAALNELKPFGSASHAIDAMNSTQLMAPLTSSRTAASEQYRETLEPLDQTGT